MFEKVNPSHPDKIADRIAGAIVDFCYEQEKNPRVAIEVLLGHGKCNIIGETSVELDDVIVKEIVDRIAGKGLELNLYSVPQDMHLAENQRKLRCGDNGIFCGCPVSNEQLTLTGIVEELYNDFHSDGKYIIDRSSKKLICCQSNVTNEDFLKSIDLFTGLRDEYSIVVNPLGQWTGGTNVDCGATNRKLGSDMGDAVTGGGLHGKDLSKADVSVNIYAHLRAQEIGEPVHMLCAIGDETIDGVPYTEIVAKAREYIDLVGGFERFAEWGLI